MIDYPESNRTTSKFVMLKKLKMPNVLLTVDCVNACEGQPLELVRFAKGHHDHCCKWEQMMMELVGEDSHMAVRHAIELLKAQRDAAFAELKEIRDYIGANENESTFDEVVRLMTKKPQP